MPEFERPIPVDEPDVDRWTDVIHSGPHGRPRRGLALVAVLLLTIGLAVTAEYEARTRDAPAPEVGARTTPSPSPRTSPITVRLPPVTLDLPGDPYAVDVGPSGFGVVLSAQCTSADRCDVGLATSENLLDWTARSVPPDVARHSAPTPVVLGHGVLLLEDLRDGAPVRWRSSDSGRTWTRAPSGEPPPVADASAGRLVLEPMRVPSAPSCGQRRVSAYLAATGQLAPLRHQPAGVRPCTVTSVPDCGDRSWVAGLDPASGGAAVALTTSHGRRWDTVRIPGTEWATFVEIKRARCEVYAVVTGDGAGTRPLRAVFHYHHGAEWYRVWRHGGRPPRIGPLTICSPGLWIAGWWPNRQLAFSFDGGDTWYVDERLGPIWSNDLGLRGWYGTYLDDRGRPRIVVSRGCQHWRGLPVG